MTRVVDLVLKVDVDTHQGLERGVPRLLECLARHGVTASFSVAMGPDNSGKAIRRLFTRKGFLKKMLRSNAVRLYGLRTALYGTLLPAPEIARSFPEILERVIEAGHEIGVHGNDHVHWHDYVLQSSEDEVAAEVGAAVATFEAILGTAPEGFAAPGWQCGESALAVLERGPFRYHSSTRGRSPYRPKAGRVVGRLPEFPTTLPTLDELLGQGIGEEQIVSIYEQEIGRCAPEVLTVHAEVEGGHYADFFSRLLARLAGRVRFRRLGELARELDPTRLPVCQIVQDVRAGRAGTVSCQAAQMPSAR